MRRVQTARRALLAAVLTGALAAASTQAAGSSDGDEGPSAQSAAVTVRTFGDDIGRLRPSCPRDCEAIGRVSGFQTAHRGRTSIYRAPARGRVIAWSIKLARPTRSQIRFFNDFYGGPASASISVLRPDGDGRYTVSGISPAERLDNFLGQEPIFVLDRPLTMRRSYIVALNTTTWAPAFATGMPRETRWRASRPRGACDDVQRRAAHVQRGTSRLWACSYRTARLMYRVYWVLA